MARGPPGLRAGLWSLFAAFLFTEPTVKPVIEGWSIEEKNTLHVNWKLPSNHEPAHGFIVHLFDSARRLVWEKNITSISVLSARITDLEFNKEYGLEVLLYHCTSLGPPSDLYKVMINSKGGHRVGPGAGSFPREHGGLWGSHLLPAPRGERGGNREVKCSNV